MKKGARGGIVARYTKLGRLKAIVAGSVGNLVEWYDWYAYSAAALYFAPIFFPKGDQTAQLLQTAAVFALGVFAPPIGAGLVGPFAPRVWRQAARPPPANNMFRRTPANPGHPRAATIRGCASR